VVRRSGKRRAAVGGAALLCAALAVGIALAVVPKGDEGEQRGVTEPRGERGAITGMRAQLVDTEQPLPAGEGVAWTTRWRLCWDAVPGTTAYLLTIATSEGVSPSPVVRHRRCYALTVATGRAPAPGERPGRRAQLGLMEPQLAVSVAASLADGATGPPSPYVSVGERYP